MQPHQLSSMLTVLRSVFEDHPAGLQLDAEMTGAMAAGLRDMERAAAVLEQREVERLEAQADQVALAAARQAASATVIPFPIIPRPRPAPLDGQVEGGVA